MSNGNGEGSMTTIHDVWVMKSKKKKNVKFKEEHSGWNRKEKVS